MSTPHPVDLGTVLPRLGSRPAGFVIPNASLSASPLLDAAWRHLALQTKTRVLNGERESASRRRRLRFQPLPEAGTAAANGSFTWPPARPP